MWNPNSWANYASKQFPNYGDKKAAVLVENRLRQLVPLVDYNYIDTLNTQLSLAANGEAFVIQLGECAESLINSTQKDFINSFYNFISKVASILQQELKLPIIKIGRIAGQFAKPRSYLLENCGSIMAFRGEIINSFNLNVKDRLPNPYRMLLAYCSAKKALKHLEECIDLNNKKNNIVQSNNTINQTNSVIVYTSHEALLLNYEAALTRYVKDKGYYNLSAHTVWLGARTNTLPSPHVEYLKGILNPIGIKIHSAITPQELVHLVAILNPSNRQGKITLIFRFNNSDIKTLLPLYIQAIKECNLNVLYMCDPMHGNTKKANGVKVRYISDLIDNIKDFITICKSTNVLPSGLHLEASFLPVTECLGGAVETVTEKNLHTNYLTTCDPRLNYNQTLELVAKVAKFIQN